jgi:hypothetical protein
LQYPSEQFLDDFGLDNRHNIDKLIKKNPNYFSVVKRGDGEGEAHYLLKSTVIHYIKKKFGCVKYLYVFNELQQLYNPFVSEYDKSKEQFKKFTLDICVIYFNHHRKFTILDIEIDGKDHYKNKQMQKDKVRDILLESRYSVHTERIDVSDPVFKHITDYLCSKIGLTPDC